MTEPPAPIDVNSAAMGTAGTQLADGGIGDAEVIRRIKDGAVDDFEVLVLRYKAKVGRIVASRVRSEDVEDVALQVFVRAFKGLGSFEGKAPFENWLSRMAVYCCHDYWRVKLREDARIARPSGGDVNYQAWLEKVSAATGDKDLDEIAVQDDTRLALEQAMSRLDAEERWLIESHYYEKMPLKEAAAVLGWSLVKTKVKAMRARHKLRKSIEEFIREWSK